MQAVNFFDAKLCLPTICVFVDAPEMPLLLIFMENWTLS